MSNIWTKEELISLIDEYKTAYKAAASGKSYTIGSRTLTRQDIESIRKQIDYLQSEYTFLYGKKIPSTILVKSKVFR